MPNLYQTKLENYYGKISREDCKPAEGDTLIKLLEVTVNADNSTTVKEHKCEI